MEHITNSDKAERLAHVGDILTNSTDIEIVRRYLGHMGLVDALAEPEVLLPEDDDGECIVRGWE